MEYKALFLDEYLNELGNKKFEPTDEFITFKKGTFNIRLEAFLYRSKDTTFYAYIYPTDEKMLLDVKLEPIKDITVLDKDKNLTESEKKTFSARIVKIKEKIEKGDLKLIVGESIIGQLARMAIMGLKNNWILIIIIAVAVGVGAGGASYTFGYNNGITQANTIINSTIHSQLFASPTPVIIQ